jgi:hypothetical protein
MKSILTLAALAVFVTAPAFAADQDGGRTFTKGGKSYQSAHSWNKKTQPQTASNTQQQPLGDLTQVEPAAGGNEPTETSKPQIQGKSFREEMRLPRKN